MWWLLLLLLLLLLLRLLLLLLRLLLRQLQRLRRQGGLHVKPRPLPRAIVMLMPLRLAATTLLLVLVLLLLLLLSTEGHLHHRQRLPPDRQSTWAAFLAGRGCARAHAEVIRLSEDRTDGHDKDEQWFTGGQSCRHSYPDYGGIPRSRNTSQLVQALRMLTSRSSSSWRHLCSSTSVPSPRSATMWR
jgi:hypothetical protein